jgi:hypothetical protein
MGFMDKAKQMAQQVQQEAKDGTLKERASKVAAQAQQKLDEVQSQVAEGGITAVGKKPEQQSESAPQAEPTEAPQQSAPAKTPPDEGSGLSSGDPLAG